MFMEQMGMYLVTGYDQAREVLLSPGRFSSQVNIPSRHSEAAQKIVDDEGYGEVPRRYRMQINPFIPPIAILLTKPFVPNAFARCLNTWAKLSKSCSMTFKRREVELTWFVNLRCHCH